MAKALYRVRGVSFPDEELYRAAEQRAALLGLSFSKYITNLIQRDLEQPSNFRMYGKGGATYQIDRPASHYSLNESGISSIPQEVAENLEAIRAVEVVVDRDLKRQPISGVAATTGQNVRPSVPALLSAKPKPSQQAPRRP